MTIYFTRFFVLRQQQDQTSSPPCAGLSKFLFEDTQTCEHVAALSELPTATIHLKPLKYRFPSPKQFEMCETTPHPSFKCVFISLGGFPEFFSNLFCAWTQSVPNNGLHSNKSGNWSCHRLKPHWVAKQALSGSQRHFVLHKYLHKYAHFQRLPCFMLSIQRRNVGMPGITLRTLSCVG